MESRYDARVRYPVREAFVANTDWNWFEFLRVRAGASGRIDEVNFWSPQASRPMKRFAPGEPIFFRLKRPRYAVAGFGFFAAFHLLDLDTAWSTFTWKNGDPDRIRFLERIGAYRHVNLLEPQAERAPLGTMVLRDAVFWPDSRWIPWGAEVGWAPNVVQGRTEKDPDLIKRLMDAMLADERTLPEEFAPRFQPFDADERLRAVAESVVREGQGAFRIRVLAAYEGKCAITGEHTEPVLDAAHIQPYRGPRSNHVQNGLLLTKEFHALFDRGYVTINPEHVVQVSPRLRKDWENGRRYYPYDGKPLSAVPKSHAERPSPEALEWHSKKVFLKSA
jgi:putative restriction endonuclease